MGVVLITGCRSGFGLLTAVEAAKRGHVVYAGLRDVDTGGDLAEATRGLPVHALALDVTVPEQRDAAVERIVAEHGRIDALVNNAGRALGGFLEQVTEQELRDLFAINVFGAFAMTKAVLPAMRAQRSGTIVMVGSMSGRMAFPALGAYASTKFALEGMSEAWRHELALFGIRMVILEPGAYKTDIWTRTRHVAAAANDPASPYARYIAHVEKRFATRAESGARDPAEVVDRICRVIAQDHPGFRHPLGREAVLRSMLLRLLPFGVVERIAARLLDPGPEVADVGG